MTRKDTRTPPPPAAPAGLVQGTEWDSRTRTGPGELGEDAARMTASARDRAACGAGARPPPRRIATVLHAAVLALLLLCRGVASGSRGDPRRPAVSEWRELPLAGDEGEEVLFGTLAPGAWDRFEVTLASTGSCEAEGFDHITFRVWDTDRVRLQNETSSTSASHGADALLIAGAGSSHLTTWRDTAPAFVSASENFWAVGSGLHADFTGFQILRPYHTVVRPLADAFSVAVYNVDEWVQTDLQYVLAAECSGAQGSCVRPAGPDGPPCAGLGRCGPRSGVCHCEVGRAGVGCEYPVQELFAGDPPTPMLISGSSWEHFVFYAGARGAGARGRRRVTVRMTRGTGRTVLFVKRRTEGQSPYGMINIYDYNTHADVQSNKLRRSEHSRSFIVDDEDCGAGPGGDEEDCVFYISVFNNGNAIYGAGSASIRVTERELEGGRDDGGDAGGDGPLVPPVGGGPAGPPADAGGPFVPVPIDNVDNLPGFPSAPFTTCANTPCVFGHCVPSAPPPFPGFPAADPTCVCTPGYAGLSCNAPLHAILLGENQSGTVPGGTWKYYVLKLGVNADAAGAGGVLQPFPNDLLVTFKQYGGQAILVAKLGTEGALPDTQTNDYLFTTPYYNPHIEQFKIGSHNLYMGSYVFGVYNAGAPGSSQMNYVLKIEVTRDDSWFPKSMMHLAIGVFAAFCLLVLFIIYKKVMYRNANMTIVQAVINAVTMAGGRQGNGAGQRPQGLELAQIQSMETFTFTAGTDIKGGEQCMVCLCDFEEGDELRLMPVCGHAFHSKCVDPWLQQSHTCPTCRRDLVEDAGADGAAAAAPALETTDERDGLATPEEGNPGGSDYEGSTHGGDVLVTITDVEDGAGSSSALSSASSTVAGGGAVGAPPEMGAPADGGSPRRLTPPGTPDTGS